MGSGWHAADWLEQIDAFPPWQNQWCSPQHKPTQHVSFWKNCKWGLDPKKRQQQYPLLLWEGGWRQASQKDA